LDNNLSSTNKTALKALALRRSPKSFTKIVVPKKPTVKFEESAQNMDTPFSTKKPIYKKKLFPKKLTSSSQITSKDILKVGTAAFRHNLYKSFMGKVTVALQISTQMRNQKGPDIQKENKKVKETYKQGLRLGAKRLKQRRKNLQKYTQEIKGASRKLLPRHKVLKSRSPRLDFSLRFQIRNTAVSPKDSRFKDLYVRLTKRVKAWYKGSLLESRSLLNASPLPSLLPDSSFRHSPDLHQLIHGKELMGPTFVGVLERNKILNPFLYGRTGALEILDIDFLIPQMKRVRTLLLLTFLRKGNILIISNDPLHSQILQEVSKRSKRLLVVSRWTHGLLTNWKQVQPHFFQKHNKKELLKDTKKYLKLCNRDRKKIHQKSTSIEFARFKKRNLKKNKNLKKKILYLKILKWRKTRNLKSHRFTKMPSKKALRGKDFLKKKRSFLVSRSKKKKKLALPTFVVVIDPDEHQDAILEARKIKIPTISFLPLGAKAHSVDYLLPVPGELTDYLYWFCQQLVNWKHQAKQMAFDLEEIFQKKKLQRKQKIRRILQIKKKARNKKKKSLRILKAVAQKRLFSPLAKQRTAQPHL
jgi:ribosomal protein S2